MRPTILFSFLALLLLGPTWAAAMTVTGRVQERGDEHVVVGGTHFLVDDQTKVFFSTRPEAKPSPYRPRYLEDVYRVRVSGVQRRAAKIVILPFGYELGERR
ncbi:hypothetical protein AN478_05535 [Thiohalorhabdus denitrificans]|uniref:Uncharacterized protein n=1 Tax=Thiohalorhabdus denitrificans TaxID=381306 RepID=A0A0P9C6Z6_9GAMM|nr:hypothetical protein [Thiohalorhabdus denitrificans]KPV40632.1 hypothetical protein AN478_05535 [Thiohalorhabdus denitrificans]SCY48903.1 hypothetical protein SAMN05661077_2273 [Thiohalorhabdus denitrificans]